MKSGFVIEIETNNLKKYICEDEDLTEEQEKEFHQAIFNVIQEHIHNEKFENLVIEEMIHEAEFLNPKVSQFSNIGSVSIKIISRG